MSVSIDLYIYDRDKLFDALTEWGAVDRPLLIRILEYCGTFTGDKYLLLNNEHACDCSPYFNLAVLLDSAFKKKDSFHILLYRNEFKEKGVNYVEVEEAAEELGIEIIEEEE